MIGIEILEASRFIRDSIMDSVQARVLRVTELQPVWSNGEPPKLAASSSDKCAMGSGWEAGSRGARSRGAQVTAQDDSHITPVGWRSWEPLFWGYGCM